MIFFSWVRELLHVAQNQSPRGYALVAGYLVAFGAIASFIYYVPNYFWLEYATAYHSEQLLRFVGITASVTVTPAGIMLNEFLVDKPCTGIQVIATFAGILVPLPKLAWVRKAIGLVLVTVGVYLANLARIVVQIWVYYAGVFDWTTVHGPGGVALGVISVAALVVLLDRFVPEFGDFVFSLLSQRKH